MKLYLSGPMTGHEDFNFPAFNDAARHLRELGFDVCNPAENDNGDTSKPREHYMRLDIAHVLECDGVAVLPGWENSHGACLEVAVARAIGNPIIDSYTGQTLKASAYETVLQEADRLIHGARRGDYGHPLDDYTRVVGAFNAMTGLSLTVEQALLFMQCVKLSRQQNKPKRDNLVDLAGYTGLLEMVASERERRSRNV